MTARSTLPSAVARSTKREDTTPKTKRKIRGTNTGRGLNAARSRGIDTSTNAGAESISPDKPLTDKQKLFVKFWAEGDSIQSASVRAGYNDASIAYRMVRMPNILALKATLSAKYEAVSEMTRQRVMDGLIEAAEMAKLISEPSSMVQAWKTIGQMCGYFAPVEHKMKIDITGNIVVDRLNGMSDKELLDLITKGQAPELSYDSSED